MGMPSSSALNWTGQAGRRPAASRGAAVHSRIHNSPAGLFPRESYRRVRPAGTQSDSPDSPGGATEPGAFDVLWTAPPPFGNPGTGSPRTPRSRRERRLLMRLYSSMARTNSMSSPAISPSSAWRRSRPADVPAASTLSPQRRSSTPRRSACRRSGPEYSSAQQISCTRKKPARARVGRTLPPAGKS